MISGVSQPAPYHVEIQRLDESYVTSVSQGGYKQKRGTRTSIGTERHKYLRTVFLFVVEAMT